MDDPALPAHDAIVVSLGPDSRGLPLAAARNAGAARAIAAGAELLVFLDVDCLPGPELVGRFHAAAARPETDRALLCGPVAYLPPPPPDGYRLATLDAWPTHPARPAPPPGELQLDDRHALFWSLSFAVTTAVWRGLGGFCESYAGYGAEDTDLAMIARQQQRPLCWVGGATAYHQWHPTRRPPTQHLDAILRNGAVFAERWGWWPMEGWFRQFASLGLVAASASGGWERAHEGPTAGAVAHKGPTAHNGATAVAVDGGSGRNSR